ncbi:TPA: hypothetical protein DCY65_01085 [Candidatus Acetothermia bacterium]|nr:hypothetical protein [Candidatus Acetothermia bacterium]
MHTVTELVKLLGLSTENQVRNRIEAVRDLLLADLRRGPNNQILVTADGVGTLRDLQALCETGHTLTDAAHILRYRRDRDEEKITGATPGLRQDKVIPAETTPDTGWRALVEHLAAEVQALSQRVAALEAASQRSAGQAAWWERWR